MNISGYIRYSLDMIQLASIGFLRSRELVRVTLAAAFQVNTILRPMA